MDMGVRYQGEHAQCCDAHVIDGDPRHSVPRAACTGWAAIDTIASSMKALRPNGPSLIADDSGSTSLEWALTLGVLAIPLYIVIQIALAYLVDLYRAQMVVNGLPLP